MDGWIKSFQLPWECDVLEGGPHEWTLRWCKGWSAVFILSIYTYLIHPSIHFLPAKSVGQVVGSLSQRSSGERRGTPWTGCQSITGPHRDKQPHTLTLTLKDNLESPINLTCMFLDGGRKPEYPERTLAYTGRTCKLHTERPQPGVEPGTFLLWGDGANHHTTVQPHLSHSHKLNQQ